MTRNDRDENARTPQPRHPATPYNGCGVTHEACPNSWKGSCDREAGHSGSHHCGSCNSAF